MHENPDKKFDLNFSYLIFQPDPRHDRVYYYLDGDPMKRILKRDDFYKLAFLKQPEMQGHIQNSCNDYSFHLWSIPDKTVTRLTLASNDAKYPDDRMSIATKRTPPIVKGDNKSLIESLSTFGFRMPTEASIKNLQVSLDNREPEDLGFFNRMFKLRKK